MTNTPTDPNLHAPPVQWVPVRTVPGGPVQWMTLATDAALPPGPMAPPDAPLVPSAAPVASPSAPPTPAPAAATPTPTPTPTPAVPPSVPPAAPEGPTADAPSPAMHLVPVQTVPGGPVEYVPVQTAAPAGPSSPITPPGPSGPAGPGRPTTSSPWWTKGIGIAAVAAGLAAVVLVARNDAADDTVAAAPASATAPVDGTAGVVATPELQISANEFSFDSPLTVTPGWVRVVMSNSGGLPHQASLYKLHDGVDGNALSEAFKTNRDAWVGKADPIGGSGGALAGASQATHVNLAAGRYIVTCFLRGGSAAGQPHVMFGMSRTLHVEGAPSGAPAPAADGEIALRDDAIVLPAGFTGRGTFHIRNEGKQPHELSVLTLNAGKTAADFTAFMKAADGNKKPSGPPPFANAGGFTIVDPGLDGYVTLDLEGGNYVAADFIPDPTKNGAPHLLNGGQVAFQVSS